MTKKTEEQKPETIEPNPFLRFLEAKKACFVVAKRGMNDMQRYSYVQEADIVSLVNDACDKNKLYWTCTFDDMQAGDYVNHKGNKSMRTSCSCTTSVYDALTGTLIQEVHSFGESLDTSDKSIYKTQTGAKKYGLMSLFGIASYDDPEKDSPLVNEEVGSKLIGETVHYNYKIPVLVFEEIQGLKDYLTKYQNKGLFYDIGGDAELTLHERDPKLDRFLLKRRK